MPEPTLELHGCRRERSAVVWSSSTRFGAGPDLSSTVRSQPAVLITAAT